MLAEALGDPLAELAVLAARERDVRDVDRRARGRACPTTAARGPRSRARARARRCSLHDPALLERPDLAARRPRRRERSRSRSRGCASSCACSCRRWRPRACASSRPATRSGGDSSATCTTARSSGSSRSACSIRRMQRSLPREASVLSPALDQIVDEVGSAIADLRQIAAGVPARAPRRRPRRGARTTSRARRRSPSRSRRRSAACAASVEAAAYFVVCEALTNAVKHASASQRRAARARATNGTLSVSVVRRRRRRRQRPPRLGARRARRPRRGPRRHARDREPARRRHAHRGRDPVRVVIAEDTVLLREGLAGLLEDAGHEVLARVGDAESAARGGRRARARPRDRRRAHAADLRGRGHAGGRRDPPDAPGARPCSCSRSTSRAATPSTSSARAAASATC